MHIDDLRAIYEDAAMIDVFERRSSQCTGHARLVRRIEGDRAALYGFSNGANPGTIVDDWGDDSEEGHHFAVLDDRYIVDPWMHGMSLDGAYPIGRCVFDLEYPADRAIIRSCYGDRSAWVRLEMHEAAADGETLPDMPASAPAPR